MSKYNPSKIEEKWQKYWEAKKFYIARDKVKDKENFYFLVEFPYPSGNLHVGHWDRYAVSDILARYFRMKGKNITCPMGFDAFGLPAENAAIKNSLQPADWTKKNITYMTKQLKSIGASFDWSREIKTTDPEYYKWTQWIFLQFYKKGLAYRAKTLVNWCPKDKTVLANEQVIDGKCDRCHTEVVQKELLYFTTLLTIRFMISPFLKQFTKINASFRKSMVLLTHRNHFRHFGQTDLLVSAFLQGPYCLQA